MEEKGNHQSIFQLSLLSTSPERPKQKSWEPKKKKKKEMILLIVLNDQKETLEVIEKLLF